MLNKVRMNMTHEFSYKLGRYKITEVDGGGLSWESHHGLGNIRKGKCLIVPYHLVFCHKKQENYAAISRSCSVDAAKKAFNMFVNFTPLSVI